MMICFFHKKKIINFSSSSLRSRAYFLLTPKHVQRQLLKTALQMRMSGNAQLRTFAVDADVPTVRYLTASIFKQSNECGRLLNDRVAPSDRRNGPSPCCNRAAGPRKRRSLSRPENTSLRSRGDNQWTAISVGRWPLRDASWRSLAWQVDNAAGQNVHHRTDGAG